MKFQNIDRKISGEYLNRTLLSDSLSELYCIKISKKLRYRYFQVLIFSTKYSAQKLFHFKSKVKILKKIS